MANNEENNRAASQATESGAAKADAPRPGASPITSAVGAPKSANARPASDAAQATGGGAQDAIALLKADHRKVEQLFAEYGGAEDARKDQIVRQVCTELILHTLLEEEIFYPACRAAASDEVPLDEAQVEHDSAKLLIRELLASGMGDAYRDAQLKVLSEQVKHHVAEEEKPKVGIFAKAQAAGVDTAELGRRIQDRKQRLQGRQGALSPSRPVSFQQLNSSNQEDEMARTEGPGRDDRGRFTSDDDDRGARGRYASERSGGTARRYDDDDDRGRGRGGWFGDPEGHSQAARGRSEGRSFRDDDDDRSYRGRAADRDRDDRGRFTSDDDDRGYRSRGNDRDRDERGRFTDDDDRGYRSRGGRDDDDERGWYGDSRGHAEAARRGWDDRGGSSSRDRDDDGGYRSRGNDRDRDERGRFADDDDRGYRSRGGRDDDDDGRGWYGDSRGHAEAARRGWEGRGGSRGGHDDDDDDGRRSSSSRGQGGWFGDSRGHSEASRRGWENRR